MNFPRIRIPGADHLARPMDNPTFWCMQDGAPAKAITVRDELNLRVMNATRLQLWEYEQILVCDELGVPRPRLFGRG